MNGVAPWGDGADAGDVARWYHFGSAFVLNSPTWGRLGFRCDGWGGPGDARDPAREPTATDRAADPFLGALELSEDGRKASVLVDEHEGTTSVELRCIGGRWYPSSAFDRHGYPVWRPSSSVPTPASLPVR